MDEYLKSLKLLRDVFLKMATKNRRNKMSKEQGGSYASARPKSTKKEIETRFHQELKAGLLRDVMYATKGTMSATDIIKDADKMFNYIMGETK